MTKSLLKRTSNQLLGMSAAVFALVGCSEEKAEQWLNKETYQFQGVFENQYNDDLLSFEQGQVTFIRGEETNSVKPFEVKDAFLTIKLRNNSMEKRDDLVMRIHGENELLTCASCAKHQLASVWQKRDYSPSPDN